MDQVSFLIAFVWSSELFLFRSFAQVFEVGVRVRVVSDDERLNKWSAKAVVKV